MPVGESQCHNVTLSQGCAFDTRVIVLFLCIGFGIPWLYFIFESTVLEAIRFHMIGRHERLCERITEQYTQN